MVTWDQLMRLHGKRYSQFEYNRTAEWLAIKERGYTKELADNFNNKWAARYKELVSKHYREAKTLFEELQRMKQEQGRIDDLIAAQYEAEEYIRVTFYENKQESTRTTEQASDDEVKRNTEKTETAYRREAIDKQHDERNEDIKKMEDDLLRILESQKKKSKRL